MIVAAIEGIDAAEGCSWRTICPLVVGVSALVSLKSNKSRDYSQEVIAAYNALENIVPSKRPEQVLKRCITLQIKTPR